jgi:hypothetical protein
MSTKRLYFWGITLRTIIVHTITYFFVGFLAFVFFDYRTRFADPALSSFLRQTDDPLVAAGPLFQPIRGLLFGFVFYLLREVLFGKEKGWLVMWVALVVIGIISTFGPAPGSIEGLIYTRVSFMALWGGLVEVLSQSFLLSAITYYWVNHPEKRWLNWVLGVLFLIVLLLPALGLLVAQANPT